MISPQYCQLMARYNAWMNQRLYDICNNLSEKELTLNRKLFLGQLKEH